MQKILLLAIIYLSFYGITSVLANDNMNSSGYTIDVCKMSILGCDSGSPPGGIEAFKVVLGKIADVLLSIIPILAVVSLLIAGYFYIFSAGDSEKASKAKIIIKWNIVAILVALLSYGIVRIVASLFN